MIGIKWRDIDFEKRTLEINRAIVKISSYRCMEGETKRDSSRRLLPLSNQVHAALCRHREIQTKSNSPLEYVFAGSDGKAIHPDCVYDLVKRIGKKIGRPDITVHAFRHTCASLLLAAGEHPKVVQDLLGHSSITVTMDLYSHVMPGLREKAVSKMDEIIIGLANLNHW